MSLFSNPAFDGHEQVTFFSEPALGFRAIIAIHRTGPARHRRRRLSRLALPRRGRRRCATRSRLSRAMTYKLALAEIPAGGAKAVVIADPGHDKSEALLLALGRAIDRLGGRFVASEDVGTDPDDLKVVARATQWVNPHAPGTDTAEPDRLRRARRHARGGAPPARPRLVRRRCASPCRGSVASATACAAGSPRPARGSSSPTSTPSASPPSSRELGAVAVAPEAIFASPVDVFAPCALGDVLDADTVTRLDCTVVAGSANNPLADDALADVLAARGILYAPDIAMSAGGVLGAAGGDPPSCAPGSTPSARSSTASSRAPSASTSRRTLAAERIARERLQAMGVRP